MSRAHWILVGGIIAAYLGTDFFCPLISRAGDDLLDGLAIGWCIGQLNLIAVWSALAPGKLVIRLPWASFLAILLWHSLLFGAAATLSTRFSKEEALLLGGSLLYGVLATQIPLFAARFGYGWRFLPPRGSPAEKDRDRQFSMGQLMIGVALVSVALGTGRAVMPPGDWSFPFDAGVFAVLTVAAVCNLVVVAPCVWLAFASHVQSAFSLLAWPVYAYAVSVVEVLVLTLLLGPPGINGDAITVAWVLNLTQSLVVFGTLFLLRAVGFGLVRTA